MDWHAHIRAAFADAVPDADVIDELAQHAAATYDAARADGCDEDEARRRVDEQVHALGARRVDASPARRAGRRSVHQRPQRRASPASCTICGTPLDCFAVNLATPQW